MSEEQPYMPGVPVTCDILAESSFSPTVYVLGDPRFSRGSRALINHQVTR